jgi:NAD(P)-dependent dehydrogenase (short-subunit alcohol dehydrogenase family)
VLGAKAVEVPAGSSQGAGGRGSCDRGTRRQAARLHARAAAYAAQAMAERSQAVLVTGCSTGIGRATARRLARAGWTVYASARRPESIADLQQDGCHTLTLDVADASSREQAVARVEREQGAVGVLINNAGYSQSGPIEQVPLDAVRRQFETNVFGVVALTQLVLPGMRAQHWGKVVNVSSMGGRLTFPGGGHYHATKHALEAISDALRFEVRGFGIDVIVIEPGLIVTEFGNAAVASMDGVGARAAGDDPYGDFNTALATATKDVYTGPMRRLGGGPDAVAKAIERAISRRRAPIRVRVTPSAHMAISSRRLMPDRAWDVAMRAQFPQPK